jgi:hypothetical protein
MLRERESGAARLEEAVEAYREALSVYTREQEPLARSQPRYTPAPCNVVNAKQRAITDTGESAIVSVGSGATPGDQTVIRSSDCIGPVVMGVCHGVPAPSDLSRADGGRRLHRPAVLSAAKEHIEGTAYDEKALKAG